MTNRLILLILTNRLNDRSSLFYEVRLIAPTPNYVQADMALVLT
ncbi:hypothetical protein [Egbenema bharatensis]